ncbi:RHS repeat-associated core domain-containing protein [Lysinibacillus endophyticus]|uniref:RHS repeat domain-containing protein n=1 Tax=Ureibacillus endophyticus TaxID=1978490 RepID=UPI0031370DC9
MREIDSAQHMTGLSINDVKLADLKYTTKGLLERIDFKNNVASIEKQYENETRLQDEVVTTKDSQETFTYSYDENHNITSIVRNEDNVTYVYDALNQLEAEIYSNGTTIHYTYDAAGNRTSKTTTKNGSTTTVDYVYNDANQLKKVNEQAYEVDANGNLVNDGKFRYDWNAFDQLIKVTTIEGETVAEYRYDDQGRRVYSKVHFKDYNEETNYRYRGTSNQVLFEEDANGSMTKAYTYDDNGYPLTMTYEGKIYYYLTNYRGDVLALVNELGEEVATYTYDAWGNILSESGSMATINPYRYAGYRYDEETNLYYLMARYYNPDTGGFLSLDPVRGDTMNPISMNGYNYANNNPVMNVDPDGEHPILVVIWSVISPILVWFAKKYGHKILSKAVKPLLKKRIQPLINKHLKNYEVKFFEGEVIFKIIKKGKGRLYSFDYGPINYKKVGNVNSFHYHINYSKMHYVYRWNSTHYKGYKFKSESNYKWVWF